MVVVNLCDGVIFPLQEVKWSARSENLQRIIHFLLPKLLKNKANSTLRFWILQVLSQINFFSNLSQAKSKANQETAPQKTQFALLYRSMPLTPAESVFGPSKWMVVLFEIQDYFDNYQKKKVRRLFGDFGTFWPVARNLLMIARRPSGDQEV